MTLRDDIEAAKIAMSGIGSHADPCRLPDTECLCGVVSAREDARHILDAILAAHPESKHAARPPHPSTQIGRP